MVPWRSTAPAGVKVTLPTTVRVWPAGSVISPAPVVTVRLPPTVEVLSVSALLSVKFTEPKRRGREVSKAALPATVRAPDWVRRPAGGDAQIATDGGGAEIQGIHIVERDSVAAHDADRAEVVGALSRVMLLAAPAVRVVGPATVRLPLSVRAPLVVTVSPPLIVEAPRSKAFTSFSTTLLPLVMATVLKSLAALSSVMLLAAPACEGGRAGHGQGAAIGEGAIGGDGEPAADGGGAEIQGIDIVQHHVVAARDTDRVEVVRALFRVMLLAAPAARVVVPATVSAPLLGERPVGRDAKVAADGGGAQIQRIAHR